MPDMLRRTARPPAMGPGPRPPGRGPRPLGPGNQARQDAMRGGGDPRAAEWAVRARRQAGGGPMLRTGDEGAGARTVDQLPDRGAATSTGTQGASTGAQDTSTGAQDTGTQGTASPDTGTRDAAGTAASGLTLDQIRAGTVAGLGATGPAIAQLQRALSHLGFGVQATGELGATTQEVLLRFQQAYGVQATGELGPTTLDMLDRALQHSITLDQLVALGPNIDEADAREWLPYLNASMLVAGLSSPARQAAYLAQLAHETDGFNTLEEYASGADYEGRSDLGNTEWGDGRRYKGRGGIQLTGRANYTAASQRLGVDLVGQPELAATPEYAFLVSADYWTQHGLNAYADRGDFEGTTDVINYYDPESRRRSRRAYHATGQELLAEQPAPTGVDAMAAEMEQRRANS